jgi:hypothetical protein
MKTLTPTKNTDFFIALNTKEEEEKKKFFLELEDNDIYDIYPENYFTQFNVIGAKMTIKFYVNPKNPGENTNLTSTLAQCYIDVTDFMAKLPDSVQINELQKNISAKIVLMKNGAYDIVKASKTFKDFFNHIFFKRSFFRRKIRKIRKQKLVTIKRKAFLHTSELFYGVFVHNNVVSGEGNSPNNIRSGYSTLKTLKVYLIK